MRLVPICAFNNSMRDKSYPCVSSHIQVYVNLDTYLYVIASYISGYHLNLAITPHMVSFLLVSVRLVNKRSSTLH